MQIFAKNKDLCSLCKPEKNFVIAILASIIEENCFQKQQTLVFHFFAILRCKTLPVKSLEYIKANKVNSALSEDLPEALDEAVQMN